jgi:hypothetical protein
MSAPLNRVRLPHAFLERLAASRWHYCLGYGRRAAGIPSDNPYVEDGVGLDQSGSQLGLLESLYRLFVLVIGVQFRQGVVNFGFALRRLPFLAHGVLQGVDRRQGRFERRRLHGAWRPDFGPPKVRDNFPIIKLLWPDARPVAGDEQQADQLSAGRSCKAVEIDPIASRSAGA